MKVVKISITGMHKIKHAEYTLNESLTYFIGENGAGKSTVLQAIQLALLGYIPGYAKTNESIMKHACSNTMSVSLELDSNIIINRTWTRKGTSVKSTVDVQGYDGEISDLIGEVELPIFNFNEFKSMTANKLKEWFITFLPQVETEVNVESILFNDEKITPILTEDLKSTTSSWLSEHPVKSVDDVKLFNAYLKEEQSFIKGQIAKLQGTIESLIKYDDVPDYDKEEVSEKIKSLTSIKDQCIKYDSYSHRKSVMESELNEIEASLQGSCAEDDKRLLRTQSQRDEFEKQYDTTQSELDKILQKHAQVSAELAKIASIDSSICPYTKEACDKMTRLMEEAKSKSDPLKDEITQINTKINELKIVRQKCVEAIKTCNDNLSYITNQYTKRDFRKKELEELNAISGQRPSDKSIEELNEELSSLQDTLAKIIANEKYDELTEQVTKDKFKHENDLEVLKVWIKATDANGLQTELMNKPFENLADSMSTYLSKMFGQPTEAHFNLVAKANSFSFGIHRQSEYIEFDYLSSGEKCLFTLALAMCILEKSKSQMQVILIDDILDHLDNENASHLFTTLKSVEKIQFILAGVQDCNDDLICYKIG